MRNIFPFILPSLLALFAACSSKPAENQQEQNHHNHEKQAMPGAPAASGSLQHISPAFTSIDPEIAHKLSSVTSAYLEVKNALAADNARDAAAAAGKLSSASSGFDKSRFTAEQKPAFDQTEKSIRENAAAIAASGNDITLQRSHFLALSNAVFGLARNFPAGRTLYQAFCPMADNNKGAAWISESEDIRNPYFGAEMLNCGAVQAHIQ